MKQVIQIFVATLIIALVGQSCLQAMGSNDKSFVNGLLYKVSVAQQYIQSLEKQEASGQFFSQNNILTLKALKNFYNEYSNQLLGGIIGTITNDTSYYYVFGRLNFSGDGASASLQVYVPGSDSISPADWIVIPPGETVNVDLALKDLASTGSDGMYGYYGLIIYNQNPQGLTASGVSSLFNLVHQGLSGSEDNSPFGQMAPNYQNMYNLAGGNLSIDFGGKSNEFCVSRTAQLLHRNHCIVPHDLLKSFTPSVLASNGVGDSSTSIFSSSRVNINMTNDQHFYYWPVTWKVNLKISNITTTQKASDGQVKKATYVMPSISEFIVTGLRQFDETLGLTPSELKVLNNSYLVVPLMRELKSYNHFAKTFYGFTDFNGHYYFNNKNMVITDSHSVNVPVSQENSYGQLAAIPTMKNLTIIADALKKKPSNWTDSLWNLALDLWGDIKKITPKLYQPIHLSNW